VPSLSVQGKVCRAGPWLVLIGCLSFLRQALSRDIGTSRALVANEYKAWPTEYGDYGVNAQIVVLVPNRPSGLHGRRIINQSINQSTRPGPVALRAPWWGARPIGITAQLVLHS
jgi:hypothetical protein